MASSLGSASDTPYATSPVGAASEQQQQSHLLASADPESGPVAAKGAKGPRRPYRPGSFLSRNRYASPATTISAVSSSTLSSNDTRGLDPSTLPPPQGLYSRPSAASSGGTLTNTSSAVSGTASPTAAFGDRT
ncbi:hypothetical protein BCV69DRAFT_105996 [Microstroma glucosiphilum]|uniref:Uncharacterized protein n=1 Tax=Pseudomicrostroma glucosiphilum TaxID=1684307 RepID=A0A316UCR2_9BASI|nr:hypothetical protein BCV69DRAFT_105996 [Pseudomicrostroma glucosiphilum]PWN23027.1 hypothetical protein BCV69DRAFT_105996 [Pseudomicrostroma glucosiphilum]